MLHKQDAFVVWFDINLIIGALVANHMTGVTFDGCNVVNFLISMGEQGL